MNLIDVRPSPSNPRQGVLRAGPLSLRVALGKGGVGPLKREGDGRTPLASMQVISGFWRADRGARPVTALPMIPARKGMIWCDAPGHPVYNRPSRLPLNASHETICRDDHLYDICIVLDWNIRERKRGCGSAIFMHLARPGYTPTEGCIALQERDMRRLLRVVSTKTRIRLR